MKKKFIIASDYFQFKNYCKEKSIKHHEAVYLDSVDRIRGFTKENVELHITEDIFIDYRIAEYLRFMGFSV